MAKDRVAVLIVRQGRLLVMRRRKHGEVYACLPGGKIEPGETPQQTGVREIQEETGLAVAMVRALGTLVNQGRTEHYFLAAPVDGHPRLGGPELARQSPDNHYELSWIGADEFDQVNLMPPDIRAMCEDVTRGRIDEGPWF
jgi:8-oxo-dGTP pyrophosphatase MutT (NUDIX family)